MYIASVPVRKVEVHNTVGLLKHGLEAEQLVKVPQFCRVGGHQPQAVLAQCPHCPTPWQPHAAQELHTARNTGLGGGESTHQHQRPGLTWTAMKVRRVGVGSGKEELREGKHTSHTHAHTCTHTHTLTNTHLTIFNMSIHNRSSTISLPIANL